MKITYVLNKCFVALFVLIVIMTMGCAGEAFNRARETNTIEAYDQFLIKHGDSKLSSQAKELREEAWFNEAKKINSISEYDEYLKEYPNGTFVAQVKKLREEAWYNKAKKTNSISEYNGYLKEYPNGTFIAQVNKLREEAWFNEAREINSISKYDEYLKEYPNGFYEAEANNLREKVRVENAKRRSEPEKWGIVAPPGCFWECVSPKGCSLIGSTAKPSPEPNDKEEYRQQRGIPSPAHVAVKTSQGYFNFLMISGQMSFDESGPIMVMGSKIVSDPYGFHMNEGWVPKCTNELEAADGILIQSR